MQGRFRLFRKPQNPKVGTGKPNLDPQSLPQPLLLGLPRCTLGEDELQGGDCFDGK